MGTIIFTAVVWVALSFAVAVLANRYKRLDAAWFFLALLISPLLAGIFLLCAGPKSHLPGAKPAMRQVLPPLTPDAKNLPPDNEGAGPWKVVTFALGTHEVRYVAAFPTQLEAELYENKVKRCARGSDFYVKILTEELFASILQRVPQKAA